MVGKVAALNVYERGLGVKRMTIAAYGKHTERAVQALLAKRAIEQRAIEQAERDLREAQERQRIEQERAEKSRRLYEMALTELEKILSEEAKPIVLRKEPIWKPTAIEVIKRKARRVFKVSEGDLVGPSRSHRVIPARLFVYYWAARRTRLSSPQIGKALGGRDHTSCLSGKRRYVELRAKDGRKLRLV